MSDTGQVHRSTKRPSITTERLVLRPFAIEDAQDVQALAGDARVADTTLRIPHPYEDGMAETWIESHEASFLDGKQIVFAITLKQSRALAGAIGLTVFSPENEAELGYWVGVPFWNQGFATEAAVAVIDYGFSQLQLDRIRGWHLVRNPQSGRVMLKAGMRREAKRQKKVEKEGREETLTSCVLRREEWVPER